jgi:MFS family permease
MMNRIALPSLKSVTPWLLVSIGMLFYCFNYFLRISPSVIQDSLSQNFHITASQLGGLVGLYYWAYTPMQIPAGMLYDKFGVRFVLCVASLMAVMGLALFVVANNYAVAGCGRFLIGLGCAFAYIGTLKIAALWLPPNRFGTVAGLTTAIGMLSGALTQAYVTQWIQTMTYQEILRMAIVAGLALSMVILLFMKNKSPQPQQAVTKSDSPINLNQLMTALRIVLRNRQMWLIGAIGCLLYLPSSVFLDLWGMPYLKAVYHITQTDAVSISSCIFYGWIISGPILGFVSDRIIKRRVLPLTMTGFCAAALLCFVFYTPGISVSWLYPIFFAIGFCCGAHSLTFALGKENNPIQISGTAVAATNMLIMMGGMVFQPVVGKLLDLHTAGVVGADGLPIYTANDYTFALSIVPIGVAIGIFLSLFVKETHCKSQAKAEDEAVFAPKKKLKLKSMKPKAETVR